MENFIISLIILAITVGVVYFLIVQLERLILYRVVTDEEFYKMLSKIFERHFRKEEEGELQLKQGKTLIEIRRRFHIGVVPFGHKEGLVRYEVSINETEYVVSGSQYRRKGKKELILKSALACLEEAGGH